MEWQPIETAPRDGRKVVLANFYDGGPHPQDARWSLWIDYWRPYFEGYGEGFGSTGRGWATHWAPLPPQISEQEAEAAAEWQRGFRRIPALSKAPA